MRIECVIYNSKGISLPTPITEEVDSFHCRDHVCEVKCKSGRVIVLNSAMVIHGHTTDAGGSVNLGFLIHGLEVEPRMDMAQVAQALWIRSVGDGI